MKLADKLLATALGLALLITCSLVAVGQDFPGWPDPMKANTFKNRSGSTAAYTATGTASLSAPLAILSGSGAGGVAQIFAANGSQGFNEDGSGLVAISPNGVGTTFGNVVPISTLKGMHRYTQVIDYGSVTNDCLDVAISGLSGLTAGDQCYSFGPNLGTHCSTLCYITGATTGAARECCYGTVDQPSQTFIFTVWSY